VQFGTGNLALDKGQDMFSRNLLAIIGTALALAFTGPAFALDLSNPAFVQVGGATSVPIGHYEFCRRSPLECGPNEQQIEAMTLTSAAWQQLVSVNAAVNEAVSPITDQDQYAVEELWTYPQGAVDCEDYVLEKRRQLITDGWVASTLLIAVVRQKSGAGHAVLVARTDRGDLVLDNQDSDIHVWNETPYSYVKRQSQTNAGEWVDVLDNRTVLVAAAH